MLQPLHIIHITNLKIAHNYLLSGHMLLLPVKMQLIIFVVITQNKHELYQNQYGRI